MNQHLTRFMIKGRSRWVSRRKEDLCKLFEIGGTEVSRQCEQVEVKKKQHRRIPMY